MNSNLNPTELVETAIRTHRVLLDRTAHKHPGLARTTAQLDALLYALAVEAPTRAAKTTTELTELTRLYCHIDVDCSVCPAEDLHALPINEAAEAVR